MKKTLSMFLAAGALSLASCQSVVYTAEKTETKLKEKSYSVQVYSYEEAKVRISGLNYEIVSFTNALFAEKGSDTNKDLLIAFYFPTGDAANKFVDDNSHENLGKMNDYADKNLGENLTKKVGVHNNVAYVGSTASFDIAFGD